MLYQLVQPRVQQRSSNTRSRSSLDLVMQCVLGVAAAWAHMAACSGLTEVVARAPGDVVRRVFALQEERKTEYKRVKNVRKVNPFPCFVTQKTSCYQPFSLTIILFVINMPHFSHKLCLLEKVCVFTVDSL